MPAVYGQQPGCCEESLVEPVSGPGIQIVRARRSEDT